MTPRASVTVHRNSLGRPTWWRARLGRNNTVAPRHHPARTYVAANKRRPGPWRVTTVRRRYRAIGAPINHRLGPSPGKRTLGAGARRKSASAYHDGAANGFHGTDIWMDGRSGIPDSACGRPTNRPAGWAYSALDGWSAGVRRRINADQPHLAGRQRLTIWPTIHLRATGLIGGVRSPFVHPPDHPSKRLTDGERRRNLVGTRAGQDAKAAVRPGLLVPIHSH